MGINKRQRHATLAFLKSTGDMGTPRQGPHNQAPHQWELLLNKLTPIEQQSTPPPLQHTHQQP